MPRLLVIQHVPHERLGTFEPAFTQADCALTVLNTHDPRAAWPSLDRVDGIVSMGGPQSVYERKKYPYLARELGLLRGVVDPLAIKRQSPQHAGRLQELGRQVAQRFASLMSTSVRS